MASTSAGGPRTTLYVGGLAEEVDKSVLTAAFIPFGPIKKIEMPEDFQRLSHRGFAFIEFDDADDASEAIANMDGAELLDRVLKVNLARPQRAGRIGGTRAVWDEEEKAREKAEMGDSTTE